MSTAVRHVEVSRERDGQRLDNLLLAELKGAPRSLIYRLIRKGQVRVNGRRAKPMQKLQAGDQVRIPPVRVSSSSGPPRFSDEQISMIRGCVIHEDRNFVAVDKPAGMAVHSGSGLSWGLIDLIRAARPSESMLELVHRLDRETSGCLLLARNRPGLLAAQEALGAAESEKRYLALLQGDLPEEPVTVRAPLRKDVVRGGERFVIVDEESGRPAVSHFRTQQRYGAWTLVEVRIETGRTHQIRVHAAHLGHPVAGDDRYGSERRPRGLERLALHCSMLTLPLPSLDDVLMVSAPLPDDLRATLDHLGRGGGRPRQKSRSRAAHR